MSDAKIVRLIDAAEKRVLFDVQTVFNSILVAIGDLARAQGQFRLDLDKLRAEFDAHVREGEGSPSSNG